MPNRYALLDLPTAPDVGEARWWLYLGALARSGVPYLNARPMDEGAAGGWWSAPVGGLAEQPDTWRVEIERPGGKRVIHYNRTPDIVSDKYPERLLPDAYASLTNDEADVYDPRVSALYQPEFEDSPAVREPVEGPWLRLDGKPPGDMEDGLTWTATLPYELRERKEYLHLFPGHLSGVRDAMKDVLEQIPGVRVHTASGKFDVSLKVALPKLPPLPKWAKPRDYSAMTGTARERREHVAREAASTVYLITRQLRLPVPDRVDGENRADAIRLWLQMRDEVVGYVESIIASPCAACGGHGYIEPVHNHEEAPTT